MRQIEMLKAERVATWWYGTVYVDPELGLPLACQPWCDEELRLKTRVVVTGREL